jgi:hypothetical protein
MPQPVRLRATLTMVTEWFRKVVWPRRNRSRSLHILPDGDLSGMVRFRAHVWTQDKRLARVAVLSSATNVRT